MSSSAMERWLLAKLLSSVRSVLKLSEPMLHELSTTNIRLIFLRHFSSGAGVEGVGNGVGEGVGDGVGEGVGDGVGEGVGDGVGEGVGDGVGEGVGVGVGKDLGVGVGEGVGDGVWLQPESESATSVQRQSQPPQGSH